MTPHSKSVYRSTHIGLALVAALFFLMMSSVGYTAGAIESTQFKNKNLKAAVSLVTGKTAISKLSSAQKVTIFSPHIAEVGNEVGIGVQTSGLKNVQSITIFAAENTRPLLATFNIPKGTEPFIKSRVKLRKSTQVMALIKADGKYYAAMKEVKITKGGCGG